MTNAHIVLTTATATAAAVAGSPGVALSGDSLITRNYGTRPRIISVWQTLQTGGFGQLSWPTAHDTTRGWRVGSDAAAVQITLPLGSVLPITPQEQIACLIAGTAVAGDVEQMSWLTLYDEGHGQSLMDWPSVRNATEKMTTVDASLVSVAGGYGPAAGELINADSDLLLANRDYAILGASSRTKVHCIAIQGPNSGNDKIGMPGNLRGEVCAQWFKLLSNTLGLPLIPIFNSGNKGSTNLFVTADENAGTFALTLHLALLK